jgi:outer membrane protein OmpA-like peptidoglycan-associated protein
MKFLRTLPALAGILTLSACADSREADELQATRALLPTGGTAFTRALTEEYKAQAIYEADVEQEYRHAMTFSGMAKRAAAGEVVPPDDPGHWKLPESVKAELAAARARLLADFAAGARECHPALSAKAQVAYDCWIEEEYEGEKEPTCKGIFHDIQPKLKLVKAERRITQVFTVYFDVGKADLDLEARKVLAEAVQAAAGTLPAAIHVTGHTDTAGNVARNLSLSERRARAVAAALTKAKAASTVADVRGMGETKPAVATPEETRKRENRRAEILFETEIPGSACDR